MVHESATISILSVEMIGVVHTRGSGSGVRVPELSLEKLTSGDEAACILHGSRVAT